MGQCHGEKSIQAVSPNNGIKKHPVKSKSSSVKPVAVERENYNLMISYCWDDKHLCHTLADRLIDDGFHVWIDRDKMSGDLYTAMAKAIDESDCILLCISESYFSSHNCQKEARYASDKNKTIIPVKVTSNYVAKEWLSFIIAGKLYFKLAGSENNFNMTYDKLVQEVLQHTRRGPPEPPPPRPVPTTQQVEQRRTAYDTALLKQITCDQTRMIDVKQHIDELEALECDQDEGSAYEIPRVNLKQLPGFTRWLAKYPQVTWLNFAPFTPTGDINDAVFLLPSDVAEDPGQFLRVWLKSYQSFICGGFGNVTHEKARDQSLGPTKAEHVAGMKECSNKQDEALLYYMKLIERHWSFNTGIAKGTTVWKTIDGFIGTGLKSAAEIERRQLLDSDLSIMKERRQQLSAYFHAEPDTFCTYAQLMRQNILDFQEACKKTYARLIKK